MDMPSLTKTKAIDAEAENSEITVLTHAILTNNLKLVKWLCSKGKEDIDSVDEFGFTAAHYACQMGSLKALKYLVRYKANLELRSKEGYTPLMMSIIKGKKECAEFLINECHCDLLVTDNDGLNVFQRCCTTGELPMARWLIERGGFKPYINIPTITTYTNRVTQPLRLPDLAVSYAVTELYVQKLIRDNQNPFDLDLEDDEVNSTIQSVIATINGHELPIPGQGVSPMPVLMKTTTGLSLDVSLGRGGPSVQGLPEAKSPRSMSKRSTSLMRIGSSRSSANIASGPAADGPATVLEHVPGSQFEPPVPLCRSQLVAMRALAARSSQFDVNNHIEALSNNSIFFKPRTAAMEANLALGGLGEGNARGSTLIGLDPYEAQSPSKSWEESLPLYEQPDPGHLFMMDRAYVFRNTVMNYEFYDKVNIELRNSSANVPKFTIKHLQMKQYLQDQKDQIEASGGEITQSDYPTLWDLQNHFSLLDNAIKTDLENVKDRPVEFAAGSTPLMLAAGYGHAHVVDWLLKYGNVDLHHVNSLGLKAWQIALKSRFPTLFSSLFVASNAILDTIDRHGNTPLLDAIVAKDYEMTCYLLAMGANPHLPDQNGKTMLMHAAIAGSLDIATVLIDCGVDLTVENNDGHDVQTIAVSYSQWAIVKLLEEALEKQVLERLEAEHGALDGLDLGLDDPAQVQTIDWNSVMQAAQDLDIDVVDYCNRMDIDIKLLDKSGRNFLHHTAINGRFEHVKVLVEKGNMNIRAKQTKAFRIYAKPTKGMNSLEMALHKKWYSIYCYLFLESVMFHDTRPMNTIVVKHTAAFADLEAGTIHEFACFARDSIMRSSNPLIHTLRLVWLFNELSELDRIHRNLYLSLAERYNKYAITLVESIPHFALVVWTLEEPDALNNTAMKIASNSDNVMFLSHHLVDKSMSSLWNATDDPTAKSIFPVRNLIRRPWFKRLLIDLSIVLRVVLFTVFLAYRVEVNDSIGIVEILSYVCTLCELVPSMPSSSRRVNAVTKKNSAYNESSGSSPGNSTLDHISHPRDSASHSEHTAVSMQPASSGAPDHLTVQQRMRHELSQMESNDIPNPNPNANHASTTPNPTNSTTTPGPNIVTPGPKKGSKQNSSNTSSQQPQIELTKTATPKSPRGSVSQLRRPSISIVQLHGVTNASAGSVNDEESSDSDSESGSKDEPKLPKSKSNQGPKTSTPAPNDLLHSSPSGTLLATDASGLGDLNLISPAESGPASPASRIPSENDALLSPQQAERLDAALEEQQREDAALMQVRQERKEQKLLRQQLAGKQESKLQLLISHLTGDGWALGDLIIALITFVMLIVRVLPKQHNPHGETARYIIYITCMSFLPMLYYWRILEIFSNLERTGPQLIMVFKMADDVLKFGVLFIVPMVFGFWQYWFLAMDKRYGKAEGYSSAQEITVTLWNTWWNQITYDFSEFDTPRQVLLLIVSIFLTFIASWFLFNMLVGIMAATIDNVMENSHSEFASRLVKSRWKMDQELLSPPPPFSILHILLTNLVSAISRIPLIRNMGPFKYRKDLWCAYCGERWTNEPFSITRPGNGAERRYPPYVLFEYSPQESGKRLCHHCLRAQRVVGWYHRMSESIAELIIAAIILVPLAFYLVFIYPFTKCAKVYRDHKVKLEYAKGSRKLTSLFATTPYEYSYFKTGTLPPLTFKFEKNEAAKKAQLDSVTSDLADLAPSNSDDE